jgi:pilus assembly protein CpaF
LPDLDVTSGATTPSSYGRGVERFSAGAAVARRGRAAGLDFGVLAPLVADPRVTDVFINGGGPVWVDRGAGLVRSPVALSELEARDLAVRLVAAGGRHVDEANPMIDTRLSDGIRVHAVLAPVSPVGTLVSVRLPAPRPPTLADLERGAFFDAVPLADVLPLVRDRVNLLITGAAGSGKTTLLAALLSRASPSERIVAIEDVAELRVRHPHFVPLEARQANLEGAGSIDLARLLREALRMRPDRLVLGECRGAEVRDLLSALNTGHDGGAGTLHANSLADVPARLEALGALAGMSPATVARQAASAIGAVLHVERVATGPQSGARRLARMGRFELDGDRLVVHEE